MAIKRMSAEEKRTVMLKIFQETRTFFNIKEIEKISGKRGINSQSFKEVLQSLIDDDLVCQEKLGASNYFWSFVKDIGKQTQDQLESNKREKNRLVDLKESLQKNLEFEKQGRENTQKRKDNIKYLNELNDELQKQNIELKKFSECDPRVYESKTKECEEIKKSINKITDDIFTLQSFVVDKFNLERAEFNKNFNIDDEMDYVE